jgi:hypothetical protein
VWIHAYLNGPCQDMGRQKGGMKTVIHTCESFVPLRDQRVVLIVRLGDKDTEQRKIRGSAMINCQWFNITARKGLAPQSVQLEQRHNVVCGVPTPRPWYGFEGWTSEYSYLRSVH